MRLGDYRLKLTELIGPWTTDPPINKNEIIAKCSVLGKLARKVFIKQKINCPVLTKDSRLKMKIILNFLIYV